jgi:hypothetical protein
LLHQWKADHERKIRASGANQVFNSAQELKSFVTRALSENNVLWRTIGPSSEAAASDPGSNLHEAWSMRKLDTIVPNNTKIINAIEANVGLLTPEETLAFFDFKSHATAWERHQYQRLDTYPRFPVHFQELMKP